MSLIYTKLLLGHISYKKIESYITTFEKIFLIKIKQNLDVDTFILK